LRYKIIYRVTLLGLLQASPIMNHFLKYKLVLGQPQPGYRFKPGEYIVNKSFAQEFVTENALRINTTM
jgi:hypothetical protein